MNRIAAIGDIHGCYEELSKLLGQLENIDQYVFLGDYLDKGPDDVRVLEILQEWQLSHNCIFILGNHEWKHLRRREHKRLTEKHYEWLIDNTQLVHTVEAFGYHLQFSHAGFYYKDRYYPTVRELLSMKGKERDKYTQVLYIRDVWEDGKQISFDINNPNQGRHWSTNKHYQDKIPPFSILVHGHAVILGDSPNPIVTNLFDKKIINIDTGCYETGCLTAAVFSNNQERVEFVRAYGTK